MQVIEADPDEAFIEQIIRDLTRSALNDVAIAPEASDVSNQSCVASGDLEAIRRKSVYRDGVVPIRLADEGYEGFNKFIP